MNGSLTIGQKVVLGFAAIVVLCGLTGGIAYYSNQSIRRNLDEVSGHILPATDALLQLDRDLQQALVDERTLLFTAPESPSFAKLSADHANNIKQVAERWDKFSTHAASFASASMRALMQTFEANRSQWLPVTGRILQQCGAAPVERRGEIIALSLGEVATKFKPYNAPLKDASANQPYKVSRRRNSQSRPNSVPSTMSVVRSKMRMSTRSHMPRSQRACSEAGSPVATAPSPGA